ANPCRTRHPKKKMGSISEQCAGSVRGPTQNEGRPRLDVQPQNRVIPSGFEESSGEAEKAWGFVFFCEGFADLLWMSLICVVRRGGNGGQGSPRLAPPGRSQRELGFVPRRSPWEHPKRRWIMKGKNGSKAESLHDNINKPPGRGTPHREIRRQGPRAIPATG